jgi:hypothetical protein
LEVELVTVKRLHRLAILYKNCWKWPPSFKHALYHVSNYCDTFWHSSFKIKELYMLFFSGELWQWEDYVIMLELTILPFLRCHLTEEGIQYITHIPIWVHSLLKKYHNWPSVYLQHTTSLLLHCVMVLI